MFDRTSQSMMAVASDYLPVYDNVQSIIIRMAHVVSNSAEAQPMIVP
jgi:hypothetical protein